jgi:hypothetical protein
LIQFYKKKPIPFSIIDLTSFISYFWSLKFFEMKKLMILIVAVAIGVAFYEQTKPDKNVYLIVMAMIIFMYGMMRLSGKTPSKNQDKEENDVE